MTLTHSESGKLGGLKTKQLHERLTKERIDEYNLNPKICQVCNSNIPYKKRKLDVCSQSCTITRNNLNRTRRIQIHSCIVCEKLTTNPKFCSTTCSINYRNNKRNDLVKKNLGSHTQTKKYLLSLDHRCNKCHNREWNNIPITLELEHKDGNSDNNSLENVELLCPNCHSQTDTYKAKNLGNGRAKRRERYKQGLSF